MIRVDVVGVLLRMTGCTGQRRMLYLTYVEYALIFLYFAGAYLSVNHGAHDNSSTTAIDGFSVQLYGVMCLLIESFLLLCVPLRVYYRSNFRGMYRYAETVGIPDDYRSSIGTITAYHLVAANVFASGAAWYAVAFDTVRAGDPFTFPFADVLPVPTANVAMYVCKYVVYVLPVYIAHIEICFLNTTFIYAAGAVKQHFEIVAKLVKEAIADGDERKLKHAIKEHQDVLKHFKNMKTVFAKPILLEIAFSALFFGFTTCLVIEAFMGNIHQILLGISITSGTISQMTTVIYCTYSSKICDLHDDILYTFLDSRLYFLDKSFKKLSLIMMSRLNVPLEFKIGYIYTINLGLLVKILKFSYTVLNVLLALLRLQKLTG